MGSEDTYFYWLRRRRAEEEAREKPKRLFDYRLGLRVVDGEEHALLDLGWVMWEQKVEPKFVVSTLEEVSPSFAHAELLEVVMLFSEYDKVRFLRALKDDVDDFGIRKARYRSGRPRMGRKISLERFRARIVDRLMQEYKPPIRSKEDDLWVNMGFGCRWKSSHLGKVSGSLNLHLAKRFKGEKTPVFVSFQVDDLGDYRRFLMDLLREHGYFNDLLETL